MKEEDCNLSPDTLDAIKSRTFGLNNAVEFAHNYLGIPQNNRPYSHKGYFMGVFGSKIFDVGASKEGIRFWYCLNTSGGSFPKFFLAMEELDTYDDGKPEDESNMSSNLFVPKMMRYSRVSIEKPKIDIHLNSDIFRNSFPTGNTISKERVLMYSKNFKDYISKLQVNPGQYLDPYCRYSVAFFKNNAAYREFMGRNPDRVAFIMGYCINNDFYPNYLRPILAGVDNLGRIIGSRVPNSAAKSEKTLLQHSWPPPPTQ